MANKKAPDVDVLLRERLRELGSKGGRKVSESLSPEERKKKAQLAARARWKKAKANKGKPR